MNNNNLIRIFDFLHEIEKLKSTLRYTQTRSGRKESTAEHSWRLALMVFLIAQELKLDLDICRALKIALVHDLAEAITGDIDAIKIAEGEVSQKAKQRLERKAIKKIKDLLPSIRGEEIYELWEEYEDRKTKEAKFVKALDKLETLTQLVETGFKTYDKPEFIVNYADQAVKDFPSLIPFLKIIKKKLRAEFKKGDIPWKKEYSNLV